MKRTPKSYGDFLKVVAHIQHPALKDHHRHWLLSLALNANELGKGARPGYKAIEGRVNRSEDCIRRWSRHCESLGIIRLAHKGKGPGDANIYDFVLSHEAYPDTYPGFRDNSPNTLSGFSDSRTQKRIPENPESQRVEPRKSLPEPRIYDSGLSFDTSTQPPPPVSQAAPPRKAGEGEGNVSKPATKETKGTRRLIGEMQELFRQQEKEILMFSPKHRQALAEYNALYGGRNILWGFKSFLKETSWPNGTRFPIYLFLASIEGFMTSAFSKQYAFNKTLEPADEYRAWRQHISYQYNRIDYGRTKSMFPRKFLAEELTEEERVTLLGIKAKSWENVHFLEQLEHKYEARVTAWWEKEQAEYVARREAAGYHWREPDENDPDDEGGYFNEAGEEYVEKEA